MHKVRGNYSSCTGGLSQKICSRNGGAQEKEREGQNRMKLSLSQKMVHLSVSSPLEGSCTFLQVFFQSYPLLDQTQGSDNVFSELYRNVYCLQNICIGLQLPHEI